MEPLSTTISSRAGQVWARIERRQVSIVRPASRVGTTTDTSGVTPLLRRGGQRHRLPADRDEGGLRAGRGLRRLAPAASARTSRRIPTTSRARPARPGSGRPGCPRRTRARRRRRRQAAGQHDQRHQAEQQDGDHQQVPGRAADQVVDHERDPGDQPIPPPSNHSAPTSNARSSSTRRLGPASSGPAATRPAAPRPAPAPAAEAANAQRAVRWGAKATSKRWGRGSVIRHPTE